MSILDEVLAEQGKPTSCATCNWLETRPRAEQAEWDVIMADKTVQHAAIHRTLVKREAAVAGQLVSRASIANHRLNLHRRPKT